MNPYSSIKIGKGLNFRAVREWGLHYSGPTLHTSMPNRVLQVTVASAANLRPHTCMGSGNRDAGCSVNYS